MEDHVVTEGEYKSFEQRMKNLIIEEKDQKQDNDENVKFIADLKKMAQSQAMLEFKTTLVDNLKKEHIQKLKISIWCFMFSKFKFSSTSTGESRVEKYCTNIICSSYFKCSSLF